MHAIMDGEATRTTMDEAPPIEEGGVEGVRLDEEMRFLGRVPGEALHHVGGRSAHVGERRMAADLVIARKLQREQEERLARQLAEHCRALAFSNAADKILPAPAEAFQQRRPFALGV